VAHPNVDRVLAHLRAGGASPRASEGMRVLPDAVTTAAAAATALGVDVGQIANSLIFEADGEPLLVLTSGAHRANVDRLAELAGVKRVRRATPDFVRRHTGQVIGGVAPLAHPKPVTTIVDVSLAAYDEVWAAGGVPQAVFPITYTELVRITDSQPQHVA